MSSASHMRQEFSWNMQREIHDGHQRWVMVLTCARCPAAAKQVSPTNKINPEAAIKKFRLMGWECDRFNPRHNRCQDCQKKPTNIVSIRKDEPIMTSASTSFATPRSNHVPTPIPEQMSKALTIEQRGAARDLLDRFFDAVRGAYSNGYSDQRVGREMNVPFAAIAAYRELAFGPLRADPEIAELRAMIDSFEKSQRDILDKAAALETAMVPIKARLDTLIKKYAP